MISQYYIILSITLFCIGALGLLTRKNALIMLMCIEIMLSAVNLLLVVFSKKHNANAMLYDIQTTAGTEAQLFVFFIMVIAAAEVTVGLSIIVMLFRNIQSSDINILNRLKH